MWRRVSPRFRRLFPWQMLSLVLSFVTGGLLFYMQPLRYWGKVFFWTKFVMMGLAGVNAIVFHLTTYRSVARWDNDPVPPFRARWPASCHRPVGGGRGVRTVDRLRLADLPVGAEPDVSRADLSVDEPPSAQRIHSRERVRESVNNLVHLLSMVTFIGALAVVDLRLLNTGMRQQPLKQVAQPALPWLSAASWGCSSQDSSRSPGRPWRGTPTASSG